VRTALDQAAQGKAGTLTDRLLLLCYHFDPLTGRYTLAILHILDGLIALSFVAAAFFAWRHVRARCRIGHP
jgi:protein SCO1